MKLLFDSSPTFYGIYVLCYWRKLKQQTSKSSVNRFSQWNLRYIIAVPRPTSIPSKSNLLSPHLSLFVALSLRNSWFENFWLKNSWSSLARLSTIKTVTVTARPISPLSAWMFRAACEKFCLARPQMSYRILRAHVNTFSWFFKRFKTNFKKALGLQANSKINLSP